MILNANDISYGLKIDQVNSPGTGLEVVFDEPNGVTSVNTKLYMHMQNRATMNFKF